jgi:hypothetical protein
LYSSFYVGLPILQQDIYEYKRLVNEADEQKISTSIVLLSKATGFVLASIGILIYLILNWENLY